MTVIMLFLVNGLQTELRAQFAPFERTDQPGLNSEIRMVTSFGNGNWLLGGGVSQDLGVNFPAFLRAVDSLGTQIWFADPLAATGYEVVRCNGAIEMADGNLLIAGFWMAGCDFLPAGNFVEKRTPGGSLIWSTQYQFNFMGILTFGVDAPSVVLEGDQQTVYVSSDSTVVAFDANGDSLLIDSLPYGYINAMAYLGPDTILIGTPNGLWQVDATLQQRAQIPGISSVAALAWFNGELYAVSDQEIFRLDPQGLNVAQSASFAAQVGLGKHTLFAEGGGLAVLYEDRVLHFDGNLQLLGTDIFGLPGKMRTIAMAGRPDGFVLAGFNGNELITNSRIAMKRYRSNGATYSVETDAAVTNVVISSINAQATPNPFVWSLTSNCIATVTNLGQDTLDFVTINYKCSQQHICWYEWKQEPFYNLGLAPGDSVQLSFSGLVESDWYSIDSVLNYDLCVWTSRPNERIDRDWENDMWCGNSLEDTLVVARLKPLVSEPLLYPQPTAEAVYLSWEGQTLTTVSLYNLNGQILRQWEQPAQVLGLSGIPAGMYFLKVSTEEGESRTLRLLKSD